MKILIIGGGGREHALAWHVSRSSAKPDLFIAPGNPGTALLGTNVAIPADDVAGLLRFANEERIDLTIVGPEAPLVAGVVDAFEAEGFAIVGPTRAAARLESSKVFAKDFMDRYGIPTAEYRRFGREEFVEALVYVRSHPAPMVVKASGLAAGKGAVVCQTREDAEDAVRSMLEDGRFGEAGDEIIVESFMEGEEASVFVLTDGERYLLLPPAQDHKRLSEGDTGPNTGGMGAYAPAPVVTGTLLARVCREIVEPTLGGMLADGCPYRGVLYVGLMMTAEGPKVVEYNCRLGDPEAQAVLPLLDADLLPVFQGIAARRLDGRPLRVAPGAAACVVLVADGYPEDPRRGDLIEGDLATETPDRMVFFAGVSTGSDGSLRTAGGRVLNVVGRGQSLEEALERAYHAVDGIHFDGMQYRRDIGRKGLDRLSTSRR